MADGKILIVAPQEDLRRSLEFLFETSGYQIVSSSAIGPAGAVPAGGFDCTVLDHRALIGPREQVLRFCERVGPVILLSDHEIGWLGSLVFRNVPKLVAGSELVVAVRAAIAASPRMVPK